LIAILDSSQVLPVGNDSKSVSEVLTQSLPAALAAGMVAIGGLLISMQVQSARIEATIVQMAKSLDDIKIDARAQLTELDQRVRALEMRP
jgi:hypothetical protein